MKSLGIYLFLGLTLMTMMILAKEFEQVRSTSNEFLHRKRGIFHPGLTACEEQKREAREDYDTDHANLFLKRTFFHPGSSKCEEQKREAREDYEERCEPSFPLFRNTGTRRFCPDIHDWKEFDKYEIGDGFSDLNPFKLDDDEQTTTTTTTRNQYDRYRRPTVSTTTENSLDIPDHDEK